MTCISLASKYNLKYKQYLAFKSIEKWKKCLPIGSAILSVLTKVFFKNGLKVKFIYSEKATTFCEISTNYLSYIQGIPLGFDKK